MALLRALRELRGDDKTFAGESAKLMIPGTGANLIATADREGTNRRQRKTERISMLCSGLYRASLTAYSAKCLGSIPVTTQRSTASVLTPFSSNVATSYKYAHTQERSRSLTIQKRLWIQQGARWPLSSAFSM